MGCRRGRHPILRTYSPLLDSASGSELVTSWMTKARLAISLGGMLVGTVAFELRRRPTLSYSSAGRVAKPLPGPHPRAAGR